MNPKTDLGHLYARHWSAYPGSNKRIAAAELEADRQACQKNYATIARESVMLPSISHSFD